MPRTQLKVQENFPSLITVFQVLQINRFFVEEVAIARQFEQIATGRIKETHLPVVERSVVDLETGNQHDLVMTFVGRDSLVGGVYNVIFALQDLEKRTILVKQHAGDGVTVVIASRGQQQIL